MTRIDFDEHGSHPVAEALSCDEVAEARCRALESEPERIGELRLTVL